MRVPASPTAGRRTILKAGAFGLLSAAVLAHRPPAAAAAEAVTGPAGAAVATSGPAGAAAIIESLCSDWRFGRARDGGLEQTFDDTVLPFVTLPHTVTPLSWHNWDPATWSGSWLYRRTFDLPTKMQGLRVFADFEGVMAQATSTIDGQPLPLHAGGYLPFSFELTDQLRPTGNVLALEVDSSFSVDVPPNHGPSSDPTSVDFWQPGGIYRPVRLRGVPTVFIADVFAKPVDVLGPTRRFDVQVTVDASAVPTDDVKVDVEVQQDGVTVASATATVAITGVGRTTAQVEVSDLDTVRLWSVAEPNLCQIVTTLRVGGDAIHDHLVTTGLREVRFETDGFYLNGERLQLMGLNRHQIFPFAGDAMPARVQRRDAYILRRVLNCNIVRCSHYPQSQDFLDACDELGLLVFCESPGWGAYIGDALWQDRVKQNVTDMVVSRRNHPSIAVWGARLNEAGSTAQGIALFTQTRDIVRGLDDSRQTTGAMTSDAKNLAAYEQDVFSINEYAKTSTGEATLTAPRSVDSKPYLVSECIGTLSGPSSTYRRTDSVAAQQGQAYAHARVHQVGGSSTRYAGVIPWAGFDYPSGAGPQVEGIKYVGVVDLFRVPKLGAAIYRAQVDPSVVPVIEPAFYWDFGPRSVGNGPGAAAIICSNTDRLEVFVGDAHLATVLPDTARFGNLPYPPSFVDLSAVDGTDRPELRIEGYIGDQLVATKRLSSQESEDRLAVTVDDTEIDADGSDATRLAFRVVDKYGAPRPYVTGGVQIDLSGPAHLVGDQQFDLEATGGVGAVWIRSRENEPGKIALTVTHPVYGPATAAVFARETGAGGQPIGEAELRSAVSPYMAPQGTQVVVSATLTNTSTAAIRDVEVRLGVDDDWSPTPLTPVTATVIQPGGTIDVRWQLTVGPGVAPGSYDLPVSAVFVCRAVHLGEEAQVTVGVPMMMAAARNNTGTTDDSAWSAGDLDGVGNTYSAQALAAAGVVPGATVPLPAGRVPVSWPDVQPGHPDNVLADGQTIAVAGTGTRVALLCASSRGPVTQSGIVHYADGSSATFSLTMDDYFYPPSADLLVAKMPYMNANGSKADNGRGGRRTHAAYLYYAEVKIRSDVQVAGVTLPTVGGSVAGGVPAMHVFDIAVG